MHRTQFRSSLLLAATALVVGLGFALPHMAAWRGVTILHTVLETLATCVALGVGALALAVHGRTGDGRALLLGVGFLGVAAIEGFQAIVTAESLSALLADHDAVVGWTWLCARLLAGLVLLVSCARRGSSPRDPTSRRREGPWLLMCFVPVAGLAAFGLAGRLHLPYSTAGMLGRPQELVPGVLLAIALAIVLRRGRWRTRAFEFWLLLGLLLGVATQVLFMARSRQVFDAAFHLAHLTKVASHGALFVGIVGQLRSLPSDASPEARRRRRGTAERDRHMPVQVARRFVAAGVLFVLFWTLGLMVVHGRLDATARSGRIINEIGRHRMRVTRLDALAFRADEPGARRALGRLADGLAASAGDLAASADEARPSAGLLAPWSPRAPSGSSDLARRLRAYADLARAQAREPDPARAREMHRRVPGLVDRLDAVVALHEHDLTLALRATQRVEWLTLLAFVLLMVGTAMFVVWPVVHRLRLAFGDLRSALAETEAARAESDRDLRQLFELSRDPICMLSLDPPAFLRVNPAWTRTLGWSREELLDRPFTALIHPEDLEATTSRLRGLQEGEPVIEFTNRYGTKAGGWRWFSWSAAPVPGQEACHAVARDVTEERRLRDHLEARAIELERSNTALDEFAYVASHDLRAPLRDVDNLSSWIAEDLAGKLPSESASHLATLRGRVQRMERLLEDLLQYSRAGRKEAAVREVDVGKLLSGLRDLASVPPDFTLDLPSEAPVVRTAGDPLERVLLNLVANAVKHHDRDVGHIDIRVREQGTELEFEVSDDGPGIPEPFHERVFELFQGLKPRDEVEASGMGLAIVRKLVTYHGGDIHLDSPGTSRGCTFRFTWPVEPISHSSPA